MSPKYSVRIKNCLMLTAGFLLFVLSIARAAGVEWTDYLRACAGLAVFGYSWYRYRLNPRLAVLILFVVPLGSGASVGRNAGFWWLIWGALILVMTVASLSSRSFCRRSLSLLDRVVVGVGLFVFGLSVGVWQLFGIERLWPGGLQWLFYLILWFLVTRWLPVLEEQGRWIRAGAVGVLSLLCLTGCVRMGNAYYHSWAGAKAQEEDAYQMSLEHYQASAEAFRALGMERMHRIGLSGLASSFSGLGDRNKAAAILGIGEDWIKVVQADEWEGPAGGNLFTNIGCWKDILLLEGEVEIRVHARGQLTGGSWPLMQVRLAGRQLGEVEVASRELRYYTFSTEVITGTHRLEITLLNGFWAVGVGVRGLDVSTAEIEYAHIRK